MRAPVEYSVPVVNVEPVLVIVIRLDVGSPAESMSFPRESNTTRADVVTVMFLGRLSRRVVESGLTGEL